MENAVNILKFIGQKFTKYSFEKILPIIIGDYKPMNETSTIDKKTLKKNGLFGQFWPSGHLRLTLNFVDGKANGEITFFDSDKKVERKGHYFNGKMHGEFRDYNKKGKLIRKELWDNGKLVENNLNEEIDRIKYLFLTKSGVIISENEQSFLDNVKQKYVGDNKLLSEYEFDEISKSVNGKVQYIIWMIKKISDNIISKENISKYKQYFNIFDKYKKKFKYQDINNYKTESDFQDWVSSIEEILNYDESLDVIDDKPFVSFSDINKLKDVGIDYLGKVDDYQIFHIPSNLSDSTLAFKRYRDILGKCANRDKGNRVHFCTLVQKTFKGYLQSGPLFIIYNMSDPLSPYQFSYEGKQFKDREDNDIF